MEGLLPLLSGLGGVLVGSFFSLWLTKLQLNNADKRLERELLKAREDAQRQRKWEVRSEPLLKLRDESARMAAKLDKLAAAAYRQLNRIGVTDEQARVELQSAMDDWNTYVASGDLAETLFVQYDAGLENEIESIRKDYQVSTFITMYFQIHKDAAQISEAMKVFEKNKARIIELQELINKRLEEL